MFIMSPLLFVRFLFAHKHKHMHMHMYIHKHTYLHIHTCTHTHTHGARLRISVVAQSSFVAQVRSACKVSTENNNDDWFGTLLRSACKVSDDWLPAEPQKWRGAPGVEAAEKEESSKKNCPDMKMGGPQA